MTRTEDNRVFIDTNVLLAATDTDREHHKDARTFLEAALNGTWRAFTSAQILREYLVVATRPLENNGLGLSPEYAGENIRAFQRLIQVLPEGPESHARLLALVFKHKLKGKRIHDANLAAVMEIHGLVQLKTYNPQDFTPFQQLSLLESLPLPPQR
jgi:predicted nucleic acid-binding protein